MTTGEKIRAARKKQGVTQQDLADAVGVTNTYVCQVERGHTEPSRRFVENVAATLCVPLSLFVDAPTVTVRSDGRYDVIIKTVKHTLTPSEVLRLCTACFDALGGGKE